MNYALAKEASSLSDLDDTAHNVKGRGVLASRKDLNLPPSEFADGCKLLQAAAIGDKERIRAILRNGTQSSMVDFRDYDRRTALHVAASEGHLDVCMLLVEKYNARVNRSDRWGGSPLDDAHRHCNAEVASYLRSHGATTGSSDNVSLFIQAAAKGDLSEVTMLVASGVISDINSGDYDKRTALHLAAGEGHVEVVDFLCAQPDINVNIEDRWGTRPLDDALQHEYAEIVEILTFYGATCSLAASNHSQSPSEAALGINQAQPLNMQVDFTELEMIDRIGGGAFGDIYKCRWKGILVAAKCIKNSKIVRDFNYDSSDSRRHSSHRMSDDEMEMILADFRMEMAILSTLRHPNVCMLLAYSNTPKLEIMVSELAKCSLLDVFVADNVNHTILSKKKQIVYAQQLAAGMNYLHTCKPPIIHRDLKPANLLLDHNGTLKITDFGLAKIRPSPKSYHEDQFTMTGETGSYRYMAPEVFKHQKYNETVDVYSFAMIFYYLLAGKPPFHMMSPQKAVQISAVEGQRPEINRNWDHRLGTLLRQCWDENPTARPCFGDILVHLRTYSHDVFKTDEDQVIGANEKIFRCNNRCQCTIS